ncbi:MAG: tetratricopeptide repeat protein [Acidiphilium sp.]|nr:tetratricopeptide repeat protein [Acidiphilium sp.]MDD4935729.1 tetratricopeptide repeat protein [Acidiphilium sp.]
MIQIDADVDVEQCAPAPEDAFRLGQDAYRHGAFAAAARYFSVVLTIFPAFFAALVNRALAYWSLGALDDAERDATAACRADPAAAEAWMVTGAIRIDRGDGMGAAEAYRRAIALRPDLAAAQAGLAAAFLALARHDDAQRAASLALALDPACTHARFTLGSARSALGDPSRAVALFDQVLAAEPEHAGARLNRGNALINLGQTEAGEADLRAATAINGDLKEAWASLGVVRTIRGDPRDAIAACDRAIALDPDFAVAHWNRGVAALLGGDYATGFAAYEWRKRHPVYGPHFDRLPAPVWQGGPLTGQHLLVRAEQGLGDTIMFARFLPILARQAAKVTLACHATLFPLFGPLGIGLCELDDQAPGDVDVAIDQMSLPFVLRLTPETIPSAAGYLAPTEAGTRDWSNVIAKPPGTLLIGLVWAGNPGHSNDQRRSLPDGALNDLLELSGFSFRALQLGGRRGEYPVADLAPLITDFGTTAEILNHIDALVTVDTSIAHLAGAMGKPCHILLSAACDWRWLLGRDTTPWYDSATLHRQKRLGDWTGPVESVISALLCMQK